MHFFKSRFFKIAFFSYVLLMGMLVVLFGSVLGYQQIQDTRRLREKDTQARMDKIVQIADSKFDTIEMMSLQLSGSDWMPYVASESDVLFSQIDYLEKQNICWEINRYNTLQQIGPYSAVIFPEKELVVDGTGFWDLERWLGLKGLDLDLEDQINDMYPSFYSALMLLPKANTNTDGNFVIAKKLKNEASVKGIFLTQVDGKQFIEYLETYLPEAIGFEIIQNNEVIFSNQQAENSKNIVERVVPSNVYGWDYRISIEEVDSGEKTQTGLMAVVLVGVVAMVLVLAYLLARFTHLPITRLVRRLGGQKGEELYGLDRLEYLFEEMSLEKEKMENLANQYLQISQNNFLNSLLAGTYDRNQIVKNIQKFQMGFEPGMIYAVTILLNLNKERKDDFLNGFLNIEIHFAQRGISTALYSEEEKENYVLIMGTRVDNEDYLNCAESITVLTDEYLSDQDVDIYTGMAHEGFEGICLSYREARDSMRMKNNQKEQLSYYYPMDVEMNINRQMHLGDFEKVEQLLLLLEQENRKRRVLLDVEKKLIYLVYESFSRFATEFDIPMDKWQGMYLSVLESSDNTQMWHFLRMMVLDIQKAHRGNDAVQAKGRQFVKYVNEHYTCSSLSQMDLAEQFGASRPTVSKIFKETTKKNFVDYLRELRVEHAKSLIHQGNRNVLEVAKASGFETEVTFKRAFLKQEGITPREYIKRCNR